MNFDGTTFVVRERFEIEGRGIVFTGNSVWDFRDRESMKKFHGKRWPFRIDRKFVEATIVDFETFGSFHGPGIGGPIGVLVKDEVRK